MFNLAEVNVDGTNSVLITVVVVLAIIALLIFILRNR